jgi:hypothetical protein
MISKLGKLEMFPDCYGIEILFSINMNYTKQIKSNELESKNSRTVNSFTMYIYVNDLSHGYLKSSSKSKNEIFS